MNGIICCPCLISAILAPLPVSQRWQNELNKDQEKDVSQPNHDLWIWPRGCFRSCLLQPHQTWWGPRMDFKILEDLFQLTIERGNLWSDYLQEDYGRFLSSQEWKSGAAEHDRSGKPEVNSWDSLQKVDPHREEYFLGRNAHSARYGETIHDRTRQPVSENLQEQAHFENFIMGSDVTEFVNQVRDQVRNRQKGMSSIAEAGDEHSIIWWMFMATTLNAATFMGQNFSTIQSVVKNHESLTLKQMFDVTAQIVNNQEEINCLYKILYGKNSWTRLSLIDDAVVINLQSTKVNVFSDSVLCFGKVLQHPESNEAWKNRVAEVRAERSYRDYDAIKWESTEFEWNIFPGFTTLQFCDKISDLLSSMGETPEIFTGIINFIYVNEQRHLLSQKRQQKWMFKECQYCDNICWKIWYWSMVNHWTRFWKEVVSFRE